MSELAEEKDLETTIEDAAKAEEQLPEVTGDPLEEAIARVQELEEQLEQSNKRVQDVQLRSRAEIENIRRRAEQDVEKAHNFALEKFAKELLEVIDNLERALDLNTQAIDDTGKAIFDGVELTYKSLLSTVNKFGIESVGVVGETFNPELHQAISMQPSEGFTTNQITQVLQKGYLLNGRVIRPAMVMVAA
ncbi:nucleotide exchange factor GrpE [Pasteurellaceae bacterium USgator11]|uniref:Protein GrpE n=2 Tax=Testudinibacter aquarius TaxID=1524974 RepID=A0A4R3Y1Q5_9PAST|nr:nucleotide exchange factor GrpE [Testudinibacter aquarius]TNG95133.1 nucleotide exchange factor GrpE [Pasteurellaceae bacterium USgator41]TNG96394.1 nucleotide exchange factor GrpE [Pasteurellaceae bacterium UScroc12]TNG98060.1 nucleotide exchange factor GrpE [Pasteurellaceae bacterium UScroc31]TNH03325.1 nucleotide exchange factor GrpE [Pasteurellaceae bacterium USgator11]TCV86045.1 molecular chaperone GrpE [Testudinibacter aquarius]